MPQKMLFSSFASISLRPSSILAILARPDHASIQNVNEACNQSHGNRETLPLLYEVFGKTFPPPLYIDASRLQLKIVQKPALSATNGVFSTKQCANRITNSQMTWHITDHRMLACALPRKLCQQLCWLLLMLQLVTQKPKKPLPLSLLSSLDAASRVENQSEPFKTPKPYRNHRNI